MFERYLETARRAIYFSRWEALRRNGSKIEPEHLLLGILQDKGTKLDMLFPLREHLAALQHRVGDAPSNHEKRDISLSNPSKRILAYAAEESERAGQADIIGPEHLMLGILRERDSKACVWLSELGVTLEDAREKIRGHALPPSTNGHQAKKNRLWVRILGVLCAVLLLLWLYALIRYFWSN